LGKARVPVTSIPLFQINITLPVANKIQVHNQLDSKDLFVLYLKWAVMPTLARGTPGFSIVATRLKTRQVGDDKSRCYQCALGRLPIRFGRFFGKLKKPAGRNSPTV